jgi:hypothetical protein
MTSIFDHKANFSGEERVPFVGRTRERVSTTVVQQTYSDSTHQFSAAPTRRKNRYQEDYVGIYAGSDKPGEYLVNKPPLTYQTEKYEDDNTRFLDTGSRKRPSRVSDRIPRNYELATQRIQRLNVFPDGTPSQIRNTCGLESREDAK